MYRDKSLVLGYGHVAWLRDASGHVCAVLTAIRAYVSGRNPRYLTKSSFVWLIESAGIFFAGI